MPTYDLGGISVHFPYEAYPCQLDFMEKAIVALQNVKASVFYCNSTCLGRECTLGEPNWHRENALSAFSCTSMATSVCCQVATRVDDEGWSRL